ncbi:MAG: DAK2 domain-containing protein, partial [Acidimicrobiales bacterium]
MSLDTLGAAELAEIMAGFASELERHKGILNRLNVYPVPDGDTGTNMRLTLESVEHALADLGGQDDLEAVCTAVSRGSLMGARGNSGVILSQILRGLSGTFRDSGGAVGSKALAEGLSEADTAARAGVMR